MPFIQWVDTAYLICFTTPTQAAGPVDWPYSCWLPNVSENYVQQNAWPLLSRQKPYVVVDQVFSVKASGVRMWMSEWAYEQTVHRCFQHRGVHYSTSGKKLCICFLYSQCFGVTWCVLRIRRVLAVFCGSRVQIVAVLEGFQKYCGYPWYSTSNFAWIPQVFDTCRLQYFGCWYCPYCQYFHTVNSFLCCK